MKALRTIITAAALLCATAAWAELPLKVLRGGREVSPRQTIDVICQTTPGATACINGQEVHVYKTGAFGRAVKLNAGKNSIKVKVSLNGECANKTICVTYDPSMARKIEEKAPAAPVPFNMNAVTKEGAYLTYGTGEDRLGGSKMSYVDAGIPIKVVGKAGDLYKLELSQNRFAFIDKEYVQQCDKEKGGPINSMNISIANTGKYDVVTLPLPSKVLFHSWIDLDPTILYVDLYGVMNNSNWIIHPRDLEMVDYVECRQVESDVLRLVIKLQKQHPWGYYVGYEGNIFRVKVKHAPDAYFGDLHIGLDAGHGGDALGAVSITGVCEKDLNLTLCRKVRALLEARGAKVTLTRDEDKAISMADRRKFLIEQDVDLLVSIHNNAGGSAYQPMGTSTYYKYVQNRQLAACVLDRILELEGVENRGLVGNFNFALGSPIEYPTFLVEGLFLSSMADEELILDEGFQDALAQKIVLGLEDYLKEVRLNP